MKNPNLIGIVLVFSITVALWLAFVNNRTLELKTIASGDSRSAVAVYSSIGIGTLIAIAVNIFSISVLGVA